MAANSSASLQSCQSLSTAHEYKNWNALKQATERRAKKQMRVLFHPQNSETEGHF